MYAKREFAHGKLNADDLQQLFKAFRTILTPMVGIRTIIEVLDRIALELTADQTGRESVEARAHERSELRYLWSIVVSAIHDTFNDIAEVIDQGFEHTAVVLEFFPKPKNSSDAEAQKPGDPAFAEYMDRKIQTFLWLTKRVS